jgi:thiol reductant ABC exporter CydC subunit
MEVFKRLLQLIVPPWQITALAALLGWLTVSSNVGLMATSAYLIAGAALHPAIMELSGAIVGVRFFGISRAVFRYLERYVTHDATFRALGKLRTSFYRAVEPIAPAGLAAFRSGDMLSRFVADVDNLQHLYLRGLAPILVAILTWVSVTIFLAWYHWEMAALFTMFFLGAGILVPWGIAQISRHKGVKQKETAAALNAHIVDSVRGMKELLSYGYVSSQSEEIVRLGNQLAKQQAQVVNIQAMAGVFSSLLAHLAMWSLLVCGIDLLTRQQLDGVLLAMLVLAGYSAFEAVVPLASVYYYLEDSLQSVRRLFAVIDKRLPDIKPGAEELPDTFDLCIAGVCFQYDQGAPWVLKNLDLYLEQGKQIAVVGTSGAGKSTITNLLLRFWDYQEGVIYLGDKELRNYAIEDIRASIGVVTQYTHLFNATIRENLILAKPDAKETELVEALRMAQIYEFITTLPEGLDTFVGEGGVKLSGGQRRRLSIARVILKNAPILLLDEVTAGLDALTEQEVMQALQAFIERKTTLMITHRLVGLEKMDEIVVLDKGHVVERGTYQELLQKNGVFRRMWELQQLI